MNSSIQYMITQYEFNETFQSLSVMYLASKLYIKTFTFVIHAQLLARNRRFFIYHTTKFTSFLLGNI